jgi:mannan endo-1,4-beta-mannosidase
MVARRTLVLLVIAVVMLAAMFVPNHQPTAIAAGSSVYWGALIDGHAYGVGDPPFDMRAVDIFESHAGKKISILRWGQPWKMNGSFVPFQTAQYEKLRQRGIIPYIDWWSQDLGSGANQPNFQSRDVTAGTYDAYIRQWARDAKAWGHPFFLRFDPEMNGWWFPWGEGKTSDTGGLVNGNATGDYVQMWRHVHDIFVAEGATNATWLWSANMMTTSTRYPPLSTLYPGGGYVDWTGLSVYNKNPQSLSFYQLMTGSGVSWLKNSYQEVLNVAPAKPMMLAEFASWEYNNDPTVKANWIKDALQTQLPTNFPKIKAAVWFNWNDNNPSDTSPIESSVAAKAAFAAAISSPYYAGSDFAALNTSPIPALAASLTTPGSVAASADTYVDGANPASTAGGTSTYLAASTSPVQKTFLKFDLTPFAGKTITAVKLRIKTTSATGAGSANSQNVQAVSDTNWKEQYMSYNTTVAVSATKLGSLAANSVPNTWYEVTLSAAYFQQNAGKLVSMAILSSGTDKLMIASRETADKPQLVITSS